MRARIATVTGLISFFSFTMAAQAGFRGHTSLTLTIPAGKVLVNATTEKALSDQFAEIQFKGKHVATVAMDSNQAGYCADLADTAQMHHKGFVLKGSGYQKGDNFIFSSVSGCELK